MKHPVMVWLKIVGEGKQLPQNEIAGAAPPVIEVQSIIFCTDFTGSVATPGQAIQGFIDEALNCVHRVHTAFLHAVEDNESVESVFGPPDRTIFAQEQTPLDIKAGRVRWAWIKENEQSNPISRGGYPSTSKAIQNALLSIGWVAKLLKGESK